MMIHQLQSGDNAGFVSPEKGTMAANRDAPNSLTDLDNLDLDFESSTGLLLYLEGVGNSSFAVWGLSLTSREMEEKDTGEDVDASNAEIYYQWNF